MWGVRKAGRDVVADREGVMDNFKDAAAYFENLMRMQMEQRQQAIPPPWGRWASPFRAAQTPPVAVLVTVDLTFDDAEFLASIGVSA